MFKFFSKYFLSAKKTPEPIVISHLNLKVVVMAFEDDCLTNCGQLLAQQLTQFPWISVGYNDDIIDKSFLNLQSRNFFDFIDTGKNILKKTKADILIWGYRENDKIRLNLQTSKQYDYRQDLYFSLLNGLYLPLSYFQRDKLPSSILNLLIAMLVSASSTGNEQVRLEKLNELINEISRESIPTDLAVEYKPFIMNMLAWVYLYAKKERLNKNDIKVIISMLNNAWKNNTHSNNKLLLGNIYLNFGQLYHKILKNGDEDKYKACRRAIECYRNAQKSFNRYVYPYDFGLQAFRLSELHFEYWKQTSDIQALRDAVFHLREAEKIFTMATFSTLWATIQGSLGFYLSLLGMFGRNDEISMLAVSNYKNLQKVYTKAYKPIEWAKAQENIGNIFYNCGKQSNDMEYLEEAVKYYQDAAEIYENAKRTAEHRQMQLCIRKADEYIMQLANSI